MKLTRKRSVIIIIAVLVLLGTALGIWKGFFYKRKVTYITATASRMDVEESVLATGVINAFKTVAVGSQVTGQLQTLHVALGDRVKKGQLLAEIDPVLQKQVLMNAEAEVLNLSAQKRSRQAQLKQYELAYQRQNLMDANDATSKADLENAQAQLESARHDIAALDAQIRKAAIAVDKEKANLMYFRIYAPINGTVISVDTEEGQTVVSTQSSTTIITLATLDAMTVKAKISEADVTRVKPGLAVYFTLLGDSDTRYYGKLRDIEPAPVSASTASASSSSSAIYYYGLFEIPNRDAKLKVSMTAQVTIVLDHAKRALCIPVSSLGEKVGEWNYRIRVLQSGEAVERVIRTGITNNVQMQVLEGLSEGEKVVIGDSATIPTDEKSGRMGPPRGRRR